MLAGELGPAARIAMELIVGVGRAVDAPDLLDISGAHIDSCLYHGVAGLDFAKALVDGGGSTRVDTTLNVSSLDLLHPDLYKGEPETAARARELMDSYVAMGCRPTWTCAPYQLPDRPQLGEHVAWGESNAIVFANSVLGARTNRYGDFLDICCAITGRAPRSGLHTDAGRAPTLHVIVDVGDRWLDDDLLYVAVGHLLGRAAGTEVALISGLDGRADEDRLKALGAAAASSGAVGLFHVEGVTPEAGGHAITSSMRRIRFDESAVRGAIVSLGSAASRLGAVSIGTPHASLAELRSLSQLCDGRRSLVPFYVSTGRDVLTLAAAEGIPLIVEEFGARFVTDTCTYITPIMEAVDGAVMTNSGKWAYYAPGNLGVDVVMGTMSDCVESAATGEIVALGLLS